MNGKYLDNFKNGPIISFIAGILEMVDVTIIPWNVSPAE